jgi:hypothetical protein
MNKEYDLVNELGPKNWLDVAAGEAVVLGMAIGDPELVVLGTELAKQLREVPYENDRFGKVEALAIDLEKTIQKKMEQQAGSLFFDSLYRGTEVNKSAYDWEYGFVYVNGQYQIKMYLPIYYDRSMLLDITRLKAVEIAMTTYNNALISKEEKETKYGHQVFCEALFKDENESVVRKIVDFNHEDGTLKRGCLECFYYDDFPTALSVWKKIRSTFISNQKK